MSEAIYFRPHARLLTMLGEQLIKNDKIALVELVKNAYDADATRVTVDFRGFGSGLETLPGSTIVITDNGHGMAPEVLRSAWMSPATPEKLRRKARRPTTDSGRILQGEKGIGRFAVFKLGAALTLRTREKSSPEETLLEIDLLEVEQATSDEALLLPPGENIGDAPEEIYLDQVAAQLQSREPVLFTDEGDMPHGTQIEVGHIRSAWSLKKAQETYADLERVQPIMWRSTAVSPDFSIEFQADGRNLGFAGDREEEFGAVLERAVLSVTEGEVDIVAREVRFLLNGRPSRLQLDDAEVRALRPFRERFGTAEANPAPEFACGSFGFEFYIFDLSNLAPTENQLDREEKGVLREHRIYLYRDGVRVYPYGDPDDDWLQIDVIRGTQSARSMFSNDQTVGYVSITQRDNPQLQDKTNREGLLELGNATRDFVALIQTVLAYLRSKPYEQYSAANRRAREQKKPIREQVDSHFEELKTGALSLQAQQAVDRLEVAINREREVAEQQIARTQDLAGVGLSVETASHDLIAAGSEALRLARLVVSGLRQLGLTGENVFSIATSLAQRLEFIDSRFADVQGLFVSSRKKRGNVDVAQLARRVGSMYAAMHSAKKIEFEVDPDLELVVNTVEGSVLQAIINLVDNATFWLLASPEPRRIRVFSSGPRSLSVSDSGPGVSASDEPFIFEPFYSGRGEDGKGLGLYIAREAGSRSGFAVELARSTAPEALGGATFTLVFDESGGTK
jgi:signal transduction histidine kinase